MNYVLLRVLARLYLDDMALKVNILLLLLLEQPTLTNTVTLTQNTLYSTQNTLC
jgi:hypothetical protein